MRSMKTQKDMALDGGPSKSESAQYDTREEWGVIPSSSRKHEVGQSRNDAQSWMCLVVKKD